jgi:thermitase
MVNGRVRRMAGWCSVTPSRRGPVRLLVALAAALVGTIAGMAPAAPLPAAPLPPKVTFPGKFRADRVVVRMKHGAAAPRGTRSISSMSSPRGEVHLLQVPTGTVDAVIERLRNDPAVDVVQPNHVYSTDAKVPNDQLYGYQWGPAAVSAPDAWSTTTGDPSASAPVVAVLDTGIDATHPDLRSNLWSNLYGTGGCAPGTHGYNPLANNCYPLDDAGHGTHVAGIIAAVGNNGGGVAGMAWNAKLMSVKVLDRNGNGDDFTAIRAINWVVAAKQSGVNIRVINASWGGLGRDQLLQDAITNAWNNGILFVTAAGNEYSNNDDPSGQLYQDPCGAPHAVCVAASDQDGTKADFSNWGKQTVALAAPGVSIASTWPTGIYPYGYASLRGTSMATPQVSGAAALVTAAEPGISVGSLRTRIVNAVDPNPTLQDLVVSGGTLNVCKAIPGCGPNPAIAPTRPIGLSAVTVDGVAKVSWKPPASSGGSAVSYSINSTATTSGWQAASAPYPAPGLGSANRRVTFSVTAKNTQGSSAVASLPVVMLGGGYVLDGWGALHPFAGKGAKPPAATGGPYWSGWDIARGVALLPSGTGGYVLDGFGGLHPFAVGSGPAPPPATGGPYWPGWDIARGVTFLNDGTGGYVIDGYGGLHPFAVGGETAPPPISSSTYWPGWDIARGVAIVPAPGTTSGGYVLDGFGGLHGFGIGGGSLPREPTGESYWRGWDIARGVTVSHDGLGGLVGDAWGGLHGWGTNGSTPPPASGGPYWPGWGVARSAAL